MVNIPTELLRTLVTVVDLRSFTKAAQTLGVTQPAVSAQIKRLQFLLGGDLFDKSVPGVSLTPAGEAVVGQARRLLSINDQILEMSGPRVSAEPVRIGMTGDYSAVALAGVLASFRIAHPAMTFAFQSANLDFLMRQLRSGDLELLIGLSPSGPVRECRRFWSEPIVWTARRGYRLDPARPVPIVSYGEECLFNRTGIAALTQANRAFERIAIGSSIVGLCALVAAGLGVMPFPRNRIGDYPELTIYEGGDLPRLVDSYCAIYAREGASEIVREMLCDRIADALETRHPLTSVLSA